MLGRFQQARGKGSGLASEATADDEYIKVEHDGSREEIRARNIARAVSGGCGELRGIVSSACLLCFWSCRSSGCGRRGQAVRHDVGYGTFDQARQGSLQVHMQGMCQVGRKA